MKPSLFRGKHTCTGTIKTPTGEIECPCICHANLEKSLEMQTMEERFEKLWERDNVSEGVTFTFSIDPRKEDILAFITAEVQRAEQKGHERSLDTFVRRASDFKTKYIAQGAALERQRIVALVEGLPRSWRSHHDLNREEVLRSIQEPKE